MAANDKALIFVSSSMSELAEERAIVKKVVQKLGDGTFETYLFEEDAVPGEGTAQDEWRRQLGRTQATLALLYQKFGEYTEEEIRLSRELQIPVLLFRKKDADGSLEKRAPEFVAWLQDAETGVITKWFDTPKELKKAVKQTLQKQIKAALDEARGARRTASPTSTDGMEVEERKAPKVRPRADPPDQLPAQRFFVGRDDEKQQLLDAIESARAGDEERYVMLVGSKGIGKEALLRHVTHSGELPEFPHGTGVAPNWTDRTDVEDLLQALWEQFYDPEGTVQPRKRDRQLKDVEALIFLLELDDAEDIRDVPERKMPKSVFCGTVLDLDVTAVPIPVDPLTADDEICAIFEKSYGGEFPDDTTRARFAELCRRQGGNPGKVELLGRQARVKARPDRSGGGPHPLVAWVDDLVRQAGLAPCSPRLAAAVSEVGEGVHAPEGVLRLVAPGESIDDAIDAGCLEAASPRYRLNPVLEPNADAGVVPDLFASTLEWARTAPATEIRANRAFVLRIMSRGLDEQRFADVIALGRSAEAAIATGARHGAWKELLECVGRAAQATGSETTLSWALHQLGSRALLRDELRQGRGYLHRSFERRRDDEDARDLTRRNLALLPAAVIPFAALVLVPLFSILIITAMFRPEERDPDLDVDFGAVVLPTAASVRKTEQLEVWGDDEVGEISVVIDDASIAGSPVDADGSGFCVVVDGRCVDGGSSGPETRVGGQLTCPPVDVEPPALTARAEEPCVLDVGFSPQVPGAHTATLRVETADGATFEGQLSGMVTAAIVEIVPDAHVFPDAEGNRRTFTMTNIGTTSLDVGNPLLRPIRQTGEGSFAIGAPECDDGDSTIDPGQSCSIAVTYLGGLDSAFVEFEISVTDEPGQPVLGDDRVLLIAQSAAADG